MTPDERTHFDAIFDAHADAIRAIREAGTHTRAAVAALEQAFFAMGHAAHALGDSFQTHDDAIAAALAANQAAMDLLNRRDHEPE